MSNVFKDGMDVICVSLPPDGDGNIVDYKTENFFDTTVKCDRITISMENGQMARVPWAKCEVSAGGVTMINLAFAESVKLAERNKRLEQADD